MRELQSLTLVYGNNAQTAHASDGYWLLAELFIPVFEEVIEYGAIVFKELFQSIEEGTSVWFLTVDAVERQYLEEMLGKFVERHGQHLLPALRTVDAFRHISAERIGVCKQGIIVDILA